ncbi:MAG: prolyl oligopeptidase family serine peptidase [Jatrophihabitans sp.]|uniref:S9 family peptidase n=1 Tax=Jatrophihabitans sp. TaxID=1932789 RepID=UPI0039129BA1
MPTVAPYGSWVSPVTADAVADGGHPVSDAGFVGTDVWWLEARPAEGGRYAVRRAGTDGPQDVLAAPWNSRTRVHEYGGGAWTATPDGVLIFAEFTDQRLYRVDEPGGRPVPLTPDPPDPGAWRYAELQILRPGEIWCVRERHADDGAIRRDIAVVPIDGSAADDESAIRSVVAGSHFLAAPRLAPDGGRLAWIAWEHPQMPWDGTELRVADLGPDGTCGPSRTLLGSRTESVLQPEWADDATLWALSDRSGYWNVHRVPVDGAAADVVGALDEEIGGPMWTLGSRWYLPLDDGRLVVGRTSGTDTLSSLDPASGRYEDIDLHGATAVTLFAVADDRLLLSSAGAHTPTGLRMIGLASGNSTVVRLNAETVPDPAYQPAARQMTFSGAGGREVHAVVYPPRNPDYVAPDGELPPFIAWVHGGPTAQTVPRLTDAIVYWTSRGIGVIDVNYGGSTGYGREYRDRLLGQWGVVDVEDTVAAITGLADAGLADPARLTIEGGSAGGWTVLAALTTTDVFACGVSHFGVAELVEFVKETHDFESRYIDGLIGPLPEAAALYAERAPLNHVDGLSCPVLLLQGLDDPIVPPAQAERFRDAMVVKGIPHAYRAYEGESHGFRRRETVVDALESALSFYGQILGFEPPGVPVLPLWRP